MRLLFDTNILVPIINERLGDLSGAVRDVLRTASDRHVSVASLWEMAIKVRLGKLAVKPSVHELPEVITGLGFDLLLIDERHVVANVSPEPNTRDPFDRLLLAQCEVEGMRLVTRDRALAAHPLAWAAG
jgi:PIN domain nuclease of toxin-antitoxin system